MSSPLSRRSVLAGLLATPVVAPHAIAQSAVGFDNWVRGLRAEALSQGISARAFDAAFSGIAPIARVVELDRKQPELTMTWARYRARVITEQRVAGGRQRLADNRSLLGQVSARFGVAPRYIVALWGIETDFGRVTGGFPVIGALATLAYEGRRSAFFRGELMHALQIIEQGHIQPSAMLGSWAGAMGQCQFMPSSFRRFAVDFDGDGRADIWTGLPDVFASIANYLASSGWHGDQSWGRQVKAPAGLSRSESGPDVIRSVDSWRSQGVRRLDGGELPASTMRASLLRPDGPNGPAFLAYDNFRTLMKWNRSTLFAAAAGQLADRIGSG
jgi:membrane-bound lytic murein transglycosylase B